MFHPVADFGLFRGIEARLIVAGQIPGHAAQPADVNILFRLLQEGQVAPMMPSNPHAEQRSIGWLMLK